MPWDLKFRRLDEPKRRGQSYGFQVKITVDVRCGNGKHDAVAGLTVLATDSINTLM